MDWGVRRILKEACRTNALPTCGAPQTSPAPTGGKKLDQKCIALMIIHTSGHESMHDLKRLAQLLLHPGN
jgi:hypothetical protein